MPLDMTIPKSRGDTITLHVFTAIAVLFALLAIVNLLILHVAMIASCIWLAFIVLMVWTGSQREDSFRVWLIGLLGDLAGSQFVDRSPEAVPRQRIYFCYRLLGYRIIQRTISVDTIESVEWSAGQATGIAGHDMNDWQVFLWYDHNDPAESRKRAKWHKPDQKIMSVGPGRSKGVTDGFGSSFVAFLQEAGARLVQDETPNHFVRDLSGTSGKTDIAPS
jgi:hypothetical protein